MPPSLTRSGRLHVLLAVGLVLAVGFVIVSTGIALAAEDDTPEERDGVVYLVAGDLAVGESEQTLGPMRIVVPDDTEEVVVEIDLAPLLDRGVDAGDAEVHIDDETIHDGSLVSATVEDGVVRLTIAPDARGFAVDEFRLTGLDTEGAEGASDVAYDGTFSHGEFDAETFDLVDPAKTTPTVDPGPVYFGHDRQQIHVENVQPDANEFTLEIDMSALEDHDIGLEQLAVDAETEDGTVLTTAVQDGTILVTVEPDSDAVLVDVLISVSGFNTDAIDSDEVVLAEGLTYGASIEGDAADTVTVGSFDVIVQTPTPVAHQPEDTTGTEHDNPDGEGDGESDSEGGAGEKGGDDAAGNGGVPDDAETVEDVALGPIVPIVAVLLTAVVLAWRRRT